MSSLTARKPAPDEAWLRRQQQQQQAVSGVGGDPSHTANTTVNVNPHYSTLERAGAMSSRHPQAATNGHNNAASLMPTIQPPNDATCVPATTDGYGNSTSTRHPFGPFPPAWVDDRTTERCMGRACETAFDGLLERRHHCRLCGKVVCQACSSRNAMLPPEWRIKEPQRVCDDCFRLALPFQAQWVKTNANAERENFLKDDETTKYMNSPLRFTLGGEIRKAAYTIQNLTDPHNVNYWARDVEYCTELLEAVEGLLFMTVGKIAFIGGVRVATGCLVARLEDGTWSAPCAVGSFGITFGACVGAEITDMVTGIDKESMLKFANNDVSNVVLGGEASFALGPFGRTASGEVHVAAAGPADHTEAYMSYSQSRGAFGGVTVEMAYLKVRDDVNEKFYGYAVKPRLLLDGTVPRPKAAAPLYSALADFYAQVFATNASSNGAAFAAASAPQNAYVVAAPHTVAVAAPRAPGALQSHGPAGSKGHQGHLTTNNNNAHPATTTASSSSPNAPPVVYGARQPQAAYSKAAANDQQGGARGGGIPPLGAGTYTAPARQKTAPVTTNASRTNPFGHFNKEDASGVLAHQAKVEAERLAAAQSREDQQRADDEELFDLFPVSPSDDPEPVKNPPRQERGLLGEAQRPREKTATTKTQQPVTVTVVGVAKAASNESKPSSSSSSSEQQQQQPSSVVKEQGSAASQNDDDDDDSAAAGTFYEPRASEASPKDDDDDLFGAGPPRTSADHQPADRQAPPASSAPVVAPVPAPPGGGSARDDDDDDLFGERPPLSRDAAAAEDDLFGEETAAL